MKKKLWFGRITTKFWVRHASACSFEASYFETLLVSHETIGICIQASDAAVVWDHEHTTDKTVKVFIFGAKEWCRSIFDTRKIFVASRDLFVIDPLNLFTPKQELPQRQDSNAIRTVHTYFALAITILFSNWNAHLAIPCYSHCYFRFGTRSRFYIST